MIKTLLLATLLVFAAVKAEDPFATEDYDAGLIDLGDSDEMFYWLLRSRRDPKTDPLVLWLTGGPGCSSELALFYENGPWTINDDLSLKKNDYSWNEISNLLYVDQPLGTGFSKTKKPEHMATNEDEVASTFYKFLVLFIEKFPEYKQRPFYITGESYAGHFIPAITAYIVEQGNPDINIVASAIGNGWVDPIVQYPEYNKFAFENNLVSTFHSYILSAAYYACTSFIKFNFKMAAFLECSITTNTILGAPKPAFNVYDIRIPCEHPPLCYDMDNLDKIIAKPEVREALQVGDRSWTQCDMDVHSKLTKDWVLDLSPKVRYALDQGVGYLIYSGDKDFICNWRGGEAWSNTIGFDGQDTFTSSTYQKWNVDGEEAGEFKHHDDFTFLRVFEAGHMVPMDQPKRSLAMLQSFIDREL
ncbi:unnamed protein product [Moneuplotes crassus]|uniref:Carboxypeptidase n=2 Tax=Euplotes crassus TaxID=5936 RepID=A0AAD1UP21_EUPCR|nr:unnamed protein product [Moneuplotes crassus]